VNLYQTLYALALLALAYPAWGRQRFAFLCLAVNLAATLLACLAMDLGAVDGESARVWMMVIDLWTGVILAMRPGLPRVISLGYALTVPLYVPLIHGLFTRGIADFAVVYCVAALQIGALFIGTLGGHSGNGGNRLVARGLPMATQGGNLGLSMGAISSNSARTGALE
jgi:hypothetical protein